jgi:Domain of unknown function (DUF4259)
MRVWDTGPFENEVAEAFAIDLDNADPDQREVLIRAALQEVVDAEDAVDARTAFRGVAAASIVAASCPGAPRIESDFAPEFLTLDNVPPPGPDLPPLAHDALDRVEEKDSGWSELWQKADSLHDAVGTLEFIRDSLC